MFLKFIPCALPECVGSHGCGEIFVLMKFRCPREVGIFLPSPPEQCACIEIKNQIALAFQPHKVSPCAFLLNDFTQFLIGLFSD